MSDDRNSITPDDEKRLREHAYAGGNVVSRNYINSSLLGLILVVIAYRCLLKESDSLLYAMNILIILLTGEFISIYSYYRKIKRKISCLGIVGLCTFINVLLVLVTLTPNPHSILVIVVNVMFVLLLLLIENVLDINTDTSIHSICVVCIIIFVILVTGMIITFRIQGDLNKIKTISFIVLGVAINYF